jgi:hypothetical protein
MKNNILETDSLQYFAALGACGLEAVLDEPFRPFSFLVEMDDSHIGYVIHDPRAIRITFDEKGYHVGLAFNDVKGVKDCYPAKCIKDVMVGGVKLKPTHTGWYTWR